MPKHGRNSLLIQVIWESDNMASVLDITIYEFILNSEDYPSMKELLDYFSTDDQGASPRFWDALKKLVENNKVLYDDKHDAWIVIDSDSPKLQKLLRESVRLS